MAWDEITEINHFFRGASNVPIYPSTGGTKPPTREMNPSYRVIWFDDVECIWISGYWQEDEESPREDYEYTFYEYSNPYRKMWEIADGQYAIGPISAYYEPIFELDCPELSLSSTKCYPMLDPIMGECYWRSDYLYLSSFNYLVIRKRNNIYYLAEIERTSEQGEFPELTCWQSPLQSLSDIWFGDAWYEFKIAIDPEIGESYGSTAYPKGRYNLDDHLSAYKYNINVEVHYDDSLSVINAEDIKGLDITTLSDMPHPPPGGVVGYNTPSELMYDHDGCYVFEIGRKRTW